MTSRRRWPALLLALLLAVVTGEPLLPHSCPMHEGGAVGAHAAGASSAEAHAHAVATEQDHVAAPAGPGDEQPSHACSCLGTCCTVAPVRLAALPVVPAAVIAALDPGFPAVLDPAPLERAERLLPFANGPPTPA